MKKEIIDFIINELLKRVEEIRRLEIADRLAYVGILVQEISGVPAIYLSREDAEHILNILGKEVRLGDNVFE
jgi:hypothetical protein